VALPAGAFCHSQRVCVGKATDDGDRRMTFTVATAELNRNGWRLNPKGWKLDNYAKNPVMLWAHDDTRMPVARAEKTWVDGELLKVRALFTPVGMSSFNDTVFEMYGQGFMRAVSAGWIPLEWEHAETEEGWEILCSKQELVEISFVPVPNRTLCVAAPHGCTRGSPSAARRSLGTRASTTASSAALPLRWLPTAPRPPARSTSAQR
jgi:hypothetical protein